MHRFAPLVVVLAACAPQSAEITGGTYTSFLAINSSRTLFEGDVKLTDAETHYGVDCRDLEEGESRLPNAIDICSDPAWPPEHEGWLRRDGFQVIQETLDPWRGEAIVTSEGDVQITFHQRLPGGEDFRFAVVLDPNFQPFRCQESASGGTEAVEVDGDWVANWSEGEDGRVFFLNAGSYQFTPSNTSDVWTLPQEWRAGYSASKFAAEEFTARRVRYGLPTAYSAYELDDFVEPESADLFYVGSEAGYPSEISRVQRVAEEVGAELALVGVDMVPKVHTNEWRPLDGRAAGLDGWVELHYNWIRFDPGSDLNVGGAASGEFWLTFDAFESQARVFINGTFDVKRFHRDRWVTDDVEATKLEEAGTTLCVE